MPKSVSIYSLLAILILFLVCHSCIQPTPLPCTCGAAPRPLVSYTVTGEVVVKWTAFTGKSILKISNLETNTDTLLLYNPVQPSGYVSITDTLDFLPDATTFSAQLQVSCGKTCSQQLTDWSARQLFSTAEGAASCPAPVLFNIFQVKGDTFYMTWQSDPSISQFHLYVADSVGNIVFQNDFSLNFTTLVNSSIVKTSLPDGDYTAWIEGLCGGGSTTPSNMAVCGLRQGGGGPIIVIDDDISTYKNAGSSGNLLNLAAIKANADCIASRNVSFLNTTNPRQLIIGYNVAGNVSSACAPTQANQQRLRAFWVSNVLTFNPSGYYRISIPRIGCVCPQLEYRVSVLANDMYQPLNVGGTFTQYCPSCN